MKGAYAKRKTYGLTTKALIEKLLGLAKLALLAQKSAHASSAAGSMLVHSQPLTTVAKGVINRGLGASENP